VLTVFTVQKSSFNIWVMLYDLSLKNCAQVSLLMMHLKANSSLKGSVIIFKMSK